MTTDPFTTAARAEAESWIGMDLDDHDNFVSGAVWARDHLAQREEDRASAMRIEESWDRWARDHLAAQEPTDAEVLAALNADYSLRYGGRNIPAESLDPYGDEHVQIMRAALTAARAVGRDAR